MSPRGWDRGSDAIGAALTFAVAVALFAWAGHWLDGRADSSPLFLIVGVVLGLFGGFVHLVKVLAPDLLPFGRGGRRDRRSGPEQTDGNDGGEDRDRPSTPR